MTSVTQRPRTMVTGAGGPAGVNVIRALESSGQPTLGVDADAAAAGLRLADAADVIPRCDDPTFVAQLIHTAVERSVDSIICTVAEELAMLSRSSDRLDQAGIRNWFPSPESIDSCIDKWRFAKATLDPSIPVPATGLASAGGVPGPWIVKPRFGRGSRDVIPVDDESELDWALRRVPEPIVQTRLSGREFTVDALADRDGSLVGAVPRWRAETKAGISTKGTTFRHADLCSAVGRLLDALGLTGPANVQGFVHDDDSFTFIEVNPRFSGGLALSQAAGADLVGEYLRGVRGGQPRPDRLTYRSGVTMLRYFEEIIES